MNTGQVYQIHFVLFLDLVFITEYSSLVLGHKTDAVFTSAPSNSQRGMLRKQVYSAHSSHCL